MPNLSASLLIALASLALGCSSGATSTVRRRATSTPAPAPATACLDTISCCLQRHPTQPELCGLSASEAVVYLSEIRAVTKEREASRDDGANAGWKRRCVDTHARCKEAGRRRWAGDCYACFVRCEREREWPSDRCHRR
ncbi:hypothetical protein HUW63_14540 [Myxococcus sp. AM001]|uniref:hypothetical protein n=1 Tax=Myxococcus vastator TaxID=2709664 RepID=UPI0013D1AC7D|nr:hypothetical protein [Myxococcus vastator]NVJ06448.1 hypothetical protein [Myxococcus sp. AM001]